MEVRKDFTYQEGGIRHPDAKTIDITKDPKTELKDITRITGFWGESGVLGLEIEHEGISLKGICEFASTNEPPHSASLRLADGEYMTGVYGQVSNKIERLTLKTSRGTAITFGMDIPDGTSFALTLKNHKIAAFSLGIGKHLYFVGTYFSFVQFPSPTLSPKTEISKEGKHQEIEELKLDYPKAITYEIPKAICMTEKLAIESPEIYGKFNDFEWNINNSIKEGKAVAIKEVMLYYSAVNKLVLGYRMKYEIRDPSKPSGKTIEVKHVASNPLTPTLHVVKSLDEGETIVQIRGRKKKVEGTITYIAIKTSLGNVIEAGNKDEKEEGTEEFSLEGKEEKNIIALAGKVTEALTALVIYCIK